MKRFTVFGLCLIAAFAFSVMVAASAQAAEEHGNLKIISKGGESHLGLSNGVEVHSTANHGSGEFNTGISGTAVGIFEGVQEEPGGLKCKDASSPLGTVKTLPLTEETGWIKSPPTSPEAGVDFKAAGAFLAEFGCEGGTAFKVEGSVIGHTAPLNVVGPGVLNLEGIGFKNEPEKFASGCTGACTTDVLLSHINGGPPLQSIQVQKNIETKPLGTKPCKPGKPCKQSAIAETNGVVEPLRPQVGRCNKHKNGKYGDKNCTQKVASKGKYEFSPAGS
jgi:hypothetical protein